jgi:UDP-N-acetylmuramoyl-tripeptide--D-alanyl-D-alanine ligase
MMTLAQAQALLPGSRLHGAPELLFDRVHSDTRTLRAGDLFVALRGERFDGHDYLAAAQAAGAVAALAEQGLSGLQPGLLPGLQVADSLQALQQLAAGWRAQFSLPLIAVTGSNGKTTVTQMLAAILHAAHGDAALATAGNLNNHIGVPLTLLRLRAPHRAAVVELGMNHAGEIAELAAWAAPTVALVNNAQREHQEFMAGVEAVARENGSVLAALPAAASKAGTAVFPAGDEYTPLWRELAAGRMACTFGLTGDAVAADVTAEGLWQSDHWALQLHTPVGDTQATLAAAGSHNLRNAAAAAACALSAGVGLQAVAAGLSAFRPVKGRSQAQALQLAGRAVTLVDDSYNANPDSVRAAIDVLASLPGPRWLLLGDMGEVGTQGPAFHAEVGACARERGIEQVWTAGALCAHAGAHRHFHDVPALLSALQMALAEPGAAPSAASILVKGSRFMQMERVVQALQQAAQDQQGADHAA